MWYKGFLVSLFLFLFFSSVKGEDRFIVSVDEVVKPWDEGMVDYRQPPYEKIEEWKSKPAYRYDRDAPKAGFWAILWGYILSWFMSMTQSGNWFVAVVILVGVGLVLFLLFRVLNVPLSGLFFLSRDRATDNLQFSDAENGLSAPKLEEMLVMYRNNKAYREAVRVLFLLYLQQLQTRGMIRLRYFKTNDEYLREIENSAERSLFKERMWLFNQVWYGQALVSQELFTKVEQAFGYVKGGEERR